MERAVEISPSGGETADIIIKKYKPDTIFNLTQEMLSETKAIVFTE